MKQTFRDMDQASIIMSRNEQIEIIQIQRRVRILWNFYSPEFAHLKPQKQSSAIAMVSSHFCYLLQCNLLVFDVSFVHSLFCLGGMFVFVFVYVSFHSAMLSLD